MKLIKIENTSVQQVATIDMHTTLNTNQSNYMHTYSI